MATGPRFYMPLAEALDGAGVSVPGALLNFYLTGSNTRAATYSDSTLLNANPNPVVANAFGIFPDIFLDPTITYKVIYTLAFDGVNPPVQMWTADPVLEAWPVSTSVYFDHAFQFLGGVPPVASEVMGMYVATRPQEFFGNFDGTGAGLKKSWGAALVAPADNPYVISVVKNGAATIGTISIAKTTGAFTFATTGGAVQTLDQGEYLTFVGQATPDSALANLAWTLTGINT